MKLVIGLPWYAPDGDNFPLHMDHMMYYGRLGERSIYRDIIGKDAFDSILPQLPSLDDQGDDVSSDPTIEDWDRLGRMEVAICNYSRISLVGKARELIVDMALEWDADYLFWWDADMRFKHSAFLSLWRHDKPVVGGLAFTARPPFHPVLYKITERFDTDNGMHLVESSEVVLDYPKDQLVGSKEVGGELAMGGAVMLYNMNVFKEIPKPWFSSTGCGEDWFFCHRCSRYNIDRYVDTSVKTQHKEHAPTWSDEESYWRSREHIRDSYVDLFGDTVKHIKDGKVVMNGMTGNVLAEASV